MKNAIYMGTGTRIILTDGRMLKVKNGQTILLTDKEFSDLSLTGNYELVKEPEIKKVEPIKKTEEHKTEKNKKGGK